MMDARIKTVVASLHRSYRGRISVVDLAASVGLSATRLRELFRAHLGISIKRCIILLRVAEAARLLRSTRDYTSQIGYSVGFSCPSHFNHAFKKMFGISPNHYREVTGNEITDQRQPGFLSSDNQRADIRIEENNCHLFHAPGDS